MVDLSYKLLSDSAEAPYLATSGSACMDVKACLVEGVRSHTTQILIINL